MTKLFQAVMLLTLSCSYVFAGEVAEFTRNGLTIRVIARDSEYEETRSYQVVVSDDVRTFSRLEVNRDGLVSDVFITDLDGDGAFEVVVATAKTGANEEGAVDIHEWRAYRFDTTAAAPLPPSERSGYRGNDQFTVENGRLLRSFPRFASDGGQELPTGEMVQFEYDYSNNRWLRVPP